MLYRRTSLQWEREVPERLRRLQVILALSLTRSFHLPHAQS